jgi:hypothetical protein
MTTITEETAETTTTEPKAARKANTAKRARNVAPKKGKAGKKATRARGFDTHNSDAQRSVVKEHPHKSPHSRVHQRATDGMERL